MSGSSTSTEVEANKVEHLVDLESLTLGDLREEMNVVLVETYTDDPESEPWVVKRLKIISTEPNETTLGKRLHIFEWVIGFCHSISLSGLGLDTASPKNGVSSDARIGHRRFLLRIEVAHRRGLRDENGRALIP